MPVRRGDRNTEPVGHRLRARAGPRADRGERHVAEAGEERQERSAGEHACSDEAEAKGAGPRRWRRQADAPAPLGRWLVLEEDPERVGIVERRVRLRALADREPVRDELVDAQRAGREQVEDGLEIAALGPPDVADGIVEAALLVVPVVPSGPVRARDGERQLLLVEHAAVEVETHVADDDDRIPGRVRARPRASRARPTRPPRRRAPRRRRGPGSHGREAPAPRLPRPPRRRAPVGPPEDRCRPRACRPPPRGVRRAGRSTRVRRRRPPIPPRLRRAAAHGGRSPRALQTRHRRS